MRHVTILGSGIAAVAAALEALAQGAEVTVIGGPPGATAMSSGAWDVANDPARYPGECWSEIPAAVLTLASLVRRFPSHPYSLIGQNPAAGELKTLLGNAIERISNQLSIRLKGDLAHPFLALTPLGTVKTTAFADPAHAAGNLLEFREARLLVVGIDQLPHFQAGLMVKVLKPLHERQGFPYLAEIRSAEISLKKLPFGLTPLDAAMQLDEDERIDELYDLLTREATRHRATHVVLPAVMGLDQTNHIFSRLAETTPCRWFETLGLTPSLPGIRLHRHLERFLRSAKLGFLPGPGLAPQAEKRRLLSLTVGKKEHPVDRLILATGKFLGGGIVHDEAGFRESVLNLPVFADGARVNETPPARLLTAQFFGEQPLMTTGVRVGSDLQPVDERGQLLYENVWAAGSVLSGYNPATQGCGMGVAVGTGTLAGRLAARS